MSSLDPPVASQTPLTIVTLFFIIIVGIFVLTVKTFGCRDQVDNPLSVRVAKTQLRLVNEIKVKDSKFPDGDAPS